jgi:hypothetical protein
MGLQPAAHREIPRLRDIGRLARLLRSASDPPCSLDGNKALLAQVKH